MRIEQIRADILAKMPAGVNTALLKFMNDFKQILDTFYGEYSPQYYIRTNAFLNSLRIIVAHSTGNGAEGTLYFEAVGRGAHLVDWHDGQGARPTPHSWSDQQILDSNMNGSHGGYAYGSPVWQDCLIKVNDNYREYLKSGLIGAGIPLH